MKECPNCGDSIMPEDHFQKSYSGMTFCSPICAESYCRNNTEHQCSFCSEPLCNFNSSEIVSSGNQIFCCVEHQKKYNKAAKDVDMYDHINDR